MVSLIFTGRSQQMTYCDRILVFSWLWSINFVLWWTPVTWYRVLDPYSLSEDCYHKAICSLVLFVFSSDKYYTAVEWKDDPMWESIFREYKSVWKFLLFNQQQTHPLSLPNLITRVPVIWRLHYFNHRRQKEHMDICLTFLS